MSVKNKFRVILKPCVYSICYMFLVIVGFITNCIHFCKRIIMIFYGFNTCYTYYGYSHQIVEDVGCTNIA